MAGYGFAGTVGFVRESSLGVLPGARTDFFTALSENLSESIERYEFQNIVGQYWEPDDSPGLRKVEGDITFAANPETLGFFLAGALGISSTAEVQSGTLYQHTFTPVTADFDPPRRPLPSWSMEIFRDVTSADHYLGCLFNKLSLNVAPNQALQVAASIIGVSAEAGSTSTATYPGSPVLPFAFDSASVQIGGAASAELTALTIDIDNQMEGDARLNASDTVWAVQRNGPQMARLSGTIAFENRTQHNLFKNQTEQELQISFIRASSFQMVIDIPRTVFTAFPLGMGGRERQRVGFEARVMRHTGSAQALEVQLFNTRSGYLI